jgi:hypothetical protein
MVEFLDMQRTKNVSTRIQGLQLAIVVSAGTRAPLSVSSHELCVR